MFFKNSILILLILNTLSLVKIATAAEFDRFKELTPLKKCAQLLTNIAAENASQLEIAQRSLIQAKASLEYEQRQLSLPDFERNEKDPRWFAFFRDQNLNPVTQKLRRRVEQARLNIIEIEQHIEATQEKQRTLETFALDPRLLISDETLKNNAIKEAISRIKYSARIDSDAEATALLQISLQNSIKPADITKIYKENSNQRSKSIRLALTDLDAKYPSSSQSAQNTLSWIYNELKTAKTLPTPTAALALTEIAMRNEHTPQQIIHIYEEIRKSAQKTIELEPDTAALLTRANLELQNTQIPGILDIFSTFYADQNTQNKSQLSAAILSFASLELNIPTTQMTSYYHAIEKEYSVKFKAISKHEAARLTWLGQHFKLGPEKTMKLYQMAIEQTKSENATEATILLATALNKTSDSELISKETLSETKKNMPFIISSLELAHDRTTEISAAHPETALPSNDSGNTNISDLFSYNSLFDYNSSMWAIVEILNSDHTSNNNHHDSGNNHSSHSDQSSYDHSNHSHSSSDFSSHSSSDFGSHH